MECPAGLGNGSPQGTDQESNDECSATFQIDRPEKSFLIPAGNPVRLLINDDSIEPALDERESED